VNVLVRKLLHRLLGDRGESEAARCLRRKGFRILERGYKTERGEIDLIARDGDTVVFVEVKTRRQGEPAEAVTPEKQRRLTLAAMQFLKRHRLFEQRSRFDVVAVVWPDPHRAPTIEHIHNAFEATELARGPSSR
jgi:putative endonuclease